jgi:uncharacterized protein YciI
MKTAALVLLAFFLCLASSSGQELQVDSLGYETFEMTEGDTTYVMKKYFMAFLKKGPNRTQSPEETEEIQRGHLAYMNELAETGQLNIAGPFGGSGDGEMQGVVIYNVPTLEIATQLVSNDPAVQAGRLIIEVLPWWAAKGSTLE